MRPPRDPFASWFGRVRVGKPDEGWPCGATGPLAPLCQVSTVELPERPAMLREVALLAVFGPGGDGGPGEVRAYRRIAELVPLEERRRAAGPRPIQWEPAAPGAEGSRVGGVPFPAVSGVDPKEFALQVCDETGRLFYVTRRGEDWRLVAA